MRKLVNKFIFVTLLIVTSGCSGYKSTWDCPKAHGIGCSSLEYADERAKEQIILNHQKSRDIKIMIDRDLLGGDDLTEVLIV
jgi:hypothetical protein